MRFFGLYLRAISLEIITISSIEPHIWKDLNLFVFVFSLNVDMSPDKAVHDLQEQLHEKDMKLTDIQLEALSSAHQLEQLRETMTRMKVGRLR